MKILHVVPTYLPAVRYGGPIVAVHGLCKSLVKRGHEVHVFTTNVDGAGVSPVPIDTPVNFDDVTVRYFRSEFPRLYWSSEMREALRRTVSDFDLVHIHAVFLWPGVAAASAARAAGVPYLIAPRGMLVPELIRRKNRLLKAIWLQVFERRGFAHAAAIHFTSALEREEAERVAIPLPAPIIIPNGIDTPQRPSVPREPRTLVFLGRVTWKKGIEQVIEALPGLNARLIVAGNDEEQLIPRLRSRAEQLHVDVQFPGPVYGPAKSALLASATLFVLTSISENFGNAVLEALAMETPVVLSQGVGLAEEVVRADAGVIGMSQVADLLDDPERRAQMGRNGRALVESRFSWSRVAEAWEEAYCSIRSRH